MQHLIDLALAREKLAEALDERNEHESMVRAWMDREYPGIEQNREKLCMAVKAAGIECKRLETDVRSAAIDLYTSTGNKKPYAGTGIRVRTKWLFDEGEAQRWCAENCKTLLKLDVKGYAKLAPSLDGAPGQSSEEPSATIAGDLSGWIATQDSTEN